MDSHELLQLILSGTNRLRPYLMTLLFLLAAGTLYADPNEGKKIPASSWWDPRTSPFIPVPEVGTDPNSGTTIGVIPTFLVTDERHDIRKIFAPDIAYNPYVGYSAHYRQFAYPSEDSQWYIVVGAKEKIERELDISYASGLLRQQSWSLQARLVYDRNATQRFFGFGNNTREADDTNYTRNHAFLQARIGFNITPFLQIAWDIRPHIVDIERGALSSLPFIGTRFAELPGLGTEHEVLNRLFLIYDTRDSVLLPKQGTQLYLFVGNADRCFLSSVSYFLFGFDARYYEPITNKITLAGHLASRYLSGGRTAPFWAYSSLGGDRSIPGERQPLRGYGDDRFIDKNVLSASLELRTEAFDFNVFSTHLTLELAPFIDLGSVFHNLDDSPFDKLHYVGGIGVRGIASPFVVGYVDFGYGSEGTAIFSGINYPF